MSCLPALQVVMLYLITPLMTDDLECLLAALAQCPRLRALTLGTGEKWHRDDVADEDLYWPFPGAAAFAKLHSLTKLSLCCDKDDQFHLADMVSALVPLTGLAELSVWLDQPDVVPATLAQLKGLTSLILKLFNPLEFEAGCLNLSNLLSLKFVSCRFVEDAQMLPGVTALQRLTCIEFLNKQEITVFDPQLVQLPQLQRLVINPSEMCRAVLAGASPGPFRLPADMGALRASLLYLRIDYLGIQHFPLALTQLVALESLRMTENHCAELPAGITALSRLTKLRLGRLLDRDDPLQLHRRPLDVRALGDLSGFPALRVLSFDCCQVMLCPSLHDAVRHASLAELSFETAYPAPECAPMVLQLSRELRRLGRGSMVTCMCERYLGARVALRAAQGRAAFQKFKADFDACGL